jgi:hypothetical protein
MGVLNVLMRMSIRSIALLLLNQVLAWRKAAKEKYRVKRKRPNPFEPPEPKPFFGGHIGFKGGEPGFAFGGGGKPKNPFEKPVDTREGKSGFSTFGSGQNQHAFGESAVGKRVGFKGGESGFSPFGSGGKPKNPFEKPVDSREEKSPFYIPRY